MYSVWLRDLLGTKSPAQHKTHDRNLNYRPNKPSFPYTLFIFGRLGSGSDDSVTKHFLLSELLERPRFVSMSLCSSSELLEYVTKFNAPTFEEGADIFDFVHLQNYSDLLGTYLWEVTI